VITHYVYDTLNVAQEQYTGGTVADMLPRLQRNGSVAPVLPSERYSAHSRIALAAVVLLVVGGCAVPASRVQMYHEWITQQRVCDAPANGSAGSPIYGYPSRASRMLECGDKPPLPPECEKPGTYELPACQEWLEEVRAQPSWEKNGNVDVDDLNLRW